MAKGNRIADVTVAMVLNQTSLGISLEKELKSQGFYKALTENVSADNGRLYTRLTKLIVSGLCMSTTGASKLSDLDSRTIYEWLRFYWDEEKSRFIRGEYWGGGYAWAVKCLRQLAIFFGTYFKNHKLLELSEVSRSPQAHQINLKLLLKNPPSHLRNWCDLWGVWRSKGQPTLKGHNQPLRRLAGWLDKLHHSGVDVSDPARFMQQKRSESFMEFVKNRPGRHRAKGVPSSLVAELSKIEKFSRHLSKTILPKAENGGFYPLISDQDLEDFKNEVWLQGRRGRPSQAQSNPLPMRLYSITEEILEEGENGWPGRHRMCRSAIRGIDVYVPVLPTLFKIPMELPERIVQFRRLDSGEGDPERFNGNTLDWSPNAGPHSGYWNRRDPSTAYRGYARRTSDSRITGFFINTNKTGDPFTIPWMNERAHQMLYELACWQERYNPIKAPVRPKDYIDDVGSADERKLKDYPPIFPLFRMPPSGGKSARPPSVGVVGRFWLDLMLEVQARWNSRCDPADRESFVKVDKNGRPQSCRYNPHGMRVAGLTLLVQAGVPIEVVSQLVAGHKTILMTLYYMKFDPADINRQLDEASVKRDSLRTQKAVRELKVMSFEAAKRRFVSTHPDAIFSAMHENGGDRLLYSDRDLGICPWDGLRCGDGGECTKRSVLRDGTDKSSYGPVEGGADSCVLCRHFLTGQEWELALIGYGTLLSRRLAIVSDKILSLQHDGNELRRKMREAEVDVAIAASGREIQRIEQTINNLSAKTTLLSKALVKTEALLSQIDQLRQPDEPENLDGRRALVAHHENSVVEWLEVSSFEQAAFLTKYGRVYKSHYDHEAEQACRRVVDEVAARSGFSPIFLSRRSEEQQRRAYDAAISLILERASRTDLWALDRGIVTLTDIGVEDESAKLIFEPALDADPLQLPHAAERERQLVGLEHSR